MPERHPVYRVNRDGNSLVVDMGLMRLYFYIKDIVVFCIDL